MYTVSIRISEEEKEALKEFADKMDLSMSQVVRRALKEYFAKHSDTNESV